jgi:hypothetical protein
VAVGCGRSAVLDGTRTKHVDGAVKRKSLQSEQQVNANGGVEMTIVDGVSFSKITKKANRAQSEESR